MSDFIPYGSSGVYVCDPEPAGAGGKVLNDNFKAVVNLVTAKAPPPGSICLYAKATAPTGWLLCDGSAVSRSTYAALYAVTGTTFGPGNGTTTFNLPDLRDRFPKGANANIGTTGAGSTVNAGTGATPVVGAVPFLAISFIVKT